MFKKFIISFILILTLSFNFSFNCNAAAVPVPVVPPIVSPQSVPNFFPNMTYEDCLLFILHSIGVKDIYLDFGSAMYRALSQTELDILKNSLTARDDGCVQISSEGIAIAQKFHNKYFSNTVNGTELNKDAFTISVDNWTSYNVSDFDVFSTRDFCLSSDVSVPSYYFDMRAYYTINGEAVYSNVGSATRPYISRAYNFVIDRIDTEFTDSYFYIEFHTSKYGSFGSSFYFDDYGISSVEALDIFLPKNLTFTVNLTDPGVSKYFSNDVISYQPSVTYGVDSVISEDDCLVFPNVLTEEDLVAGSIDYDLLVDSITQAITEAYVEPNIFVEPKVDVSVDTDLDGFLGDLIDAISSLFDSLVNSILGGIVDLFVPADNFISDKVSEFNSTVFEPFGFNYDFASRFGNETPLNDIYFNFWGHEIKIIDFSWFNNSFSRFKSLIRGFIVFLLIVFNINQFLGLIGQPSISEGIGNPSHEKKKGGKP